MKGRSNAWWTAQLKGWLPDHGDWTAVPARRRYFRDLVPFTWTQGPPLIALSADEVVLLRQDAARSRVTEILLRGSREGTRLTRHWNGRVARLSIAPGVEVQIDGRAEVARFEQAWRDDRA